MEIFLGKAITRWIWIKETPHEICSHHIIFFSCFLCSFQFIIFYVINMSRYYYVINFVSLFLRISSNIDLRKSVRFHKELGWSGVPFHAWWISRVVLMSFVIMLIDTVWRDNRWQAFTPKSNIEILYPSVPEYNWFFWN